MPAIASYHPHIVHFVIALLFLGVAFRLASLSGKLAFTGPAAATLILLGTLGAVAAVESGDQAHGVAEQVPGARAAVVEHEEWGERARNVFLVVSALELLALLLAAARSRGVKAAAAASALVGLAGLFVLYEAAEHGGELVYSYAGGVGTRSGDPADVGHLLVAGVYHQANLDRAAGRTEEASALVELTARRFPENLELQLMAIDWQIAVRKDPAGALQRLARLRVPPEDTRLRVRARVLEADAHAAAGDAAAARQVLEALKREFPANPLVARRLAALDAKRP